MENRTERAGNVKSVSGQTARVSRGRRWIKRSGEIAKSYTGELDIEENLNCLGAWTAYRCLSL